MTEQEEKEHKLLLNIKDTVKEYLTIDPKSFTASITLGKMERGLEKWDYRYGTCYDCYDSIKELNAFTSCEECGVTLCWECDYRFGLCETCSRAEQKRDIETI